MSVTSVPSVTTEAGEEAVAAAVYPRQAQGGGLGQGGLRVPEGPQPELVPVGKGAAASASVQRMINTPGAQSSAMSEPFFDGGRVVNTSGAQSPAMSDPRFDGVADQGTHCHADRTLVSPKMLLLILAI